MTDFERTIAEIRDLLSEAARHARTEPDKAGPYIVRAANMLLGLGVFHTRLVDNLSVARMNLLAAPSAAAGYVEGVNHELGRHADWLRRRREAAGRDRELAEAFGER